MKNNPRNTKPNSKLYSANQFVDQKIQNRENHKYKSFSDAFHYHRARHLYVCKEGRRAEGAELGGFVVTHFFSFFLSFSFIARIIMSFLKRVMKSRKRSTQCQM